LRLNEPELRAVADTPEAGYAFIYFLWITASLLMVFYAWKLQQRTLRQQDRTP
jgi:hypothetical protein